MRIGLIAPPWLPVPPPAYGGTEAVIDGLARGLVLAGHEVLLAAAANSSCPVTRVSGLEDAPDQAAVIADTPTELRHVIRSHDLLRGRVDVVHDHTLAGPIYGRHIGSTPLVTTNHGPFNSDLTTIYRAIDDVWITAISHHQASTATRVPIRAVVHHGIDLDQVPVGDGHGGYASFLGRMSPDKGAREAALVARAAGVPLRMAAKMREPEEYDYFEAQVKPLLGPDVEYVGELSFRDKVELLGASFAMLNPVQWPEPFGLVMVESLAAGTPVVGTPCGSAPEIVDHGVTGYLRPDLPGLSQALLDAAGIDRHACRATAVRRFTTARMVAEYAALYQRAARETATLNGKAGRRGSDLFQHP